MDMEVLQVCMLAFSIVALIAVEDEGLALPLCPLAGNAASKTTGEKALHLKQNTHLLSEIRVGFL